MFDVLHQIETEVGMGKIEEDLNGLQLGFLKIIVQPNSSSKFLSVISNSSYL